MPELLSGCRKAPIMAVGINPNLPGWWANQRGSMNPLFDDYRQYAHYFRYRAVDKLELSDADYLAYGGGPQDTPFSDFELSVPADDHGERRIRLQVQPQKMYQTYQSLLDALSKAMGWDAQLVVGEDLSYANMVASPSAKWTTVPGARRPDAAPDDRRGARRHRHRVLPDPQVLPAPDVPEPSRGDPHLQPVDGQRVRGRDERVLHGR